ncbi:MAG: class I SAM-dependent methyltransferase [Actinobacteria bacterium]|nr:class I SAM-dependent methyltransferase [Actinomycetota bacterium]MBA3561280.1 class I SAM-dependent methyltransferase [Actinomycetota bacterium]MBA3565540.1 class I SAM-dependent methyltransferase [Actinomycetota bacterium]
MTLYDKIARFYDPWSRSVTEDVGFYVDQALASGGPVVELAVGTGRIAVPIAQAGVSLIGVDSSPEMLVVAREAAEAAGVGDLLDLRVGDLREPPVPERVPLVICPFRSLLHMETEAEKLRALRAAGSLLEPGGRLVFDVFAPSRDDIVDTHDRWFEREPGIFERAVWDDGSRTLSLSVRSGDASATFGLHWLSAPEWLRLLDAAGLEVEALYGWFDSRPYADDEDMIFVCRPRALDEVDRVAERDLSALDDMSKHAALVVELGAQPVAKLVHPVAGIAHHGDLEQSRADLDALTYRPGLDVGAFHRDVLADRSRLDVDCIQMLFRGEQHFAPRRIRVGAAFEALILDCEHALSRLRAAALAAR